MIFRRCGDCEHFRHSNQASVYSEALGSCQAPIPLIAEVVRRIVKASDGAGCEAWARRSRVYHPRPVEEVTT